MSAEQPGVVTLQVSSQSINIISKHPQDAPAILIVPVHSHVQVTMDGELVKGRVEVYPESRLEIRCSVIESERDAKIVVSNDKMSARLSVQYINGTRVTISDEIPARTLALKIREETVIPDLFQMSEVELLLQQLGIVPGAVDWGGIQRTIETGQSGECICAQGLSPTEIIPEHYEMVIRESSEPVMIGIVRIQPVLTVRQDETIAVRRPMVDGKVGTNIYGQPVPPNQVKTKLPSLGKGVIETEDGFVKSTRGGRVISTPALLDVTIRLEIGDSLTLASGHVQFEGDVVIRGDVNEGVEISAGGLVTVNGYVSQASIMADGGVVVNGGVFQSTITAGTRLAILNDLKHMLSSLKDEFSQFTQAASQLFLALGSRATQVGAGKIAGSLLNEKFSHVLRWPKMLLEWKQMHESSISGMWTTWLDHIVSEIGPNKLLATRDLQPWQSLIEEIEKRLSDIPENEELEVNVQVKNAQHSKIESSGRILCTGQGFYQCELKANQNIEALGTPGVILGCEANCGENVTAREIGSQAESTTVIRVQSKNGQVKANLIHPGTVLSVGPWSHKVTVEMRDVNWP